MPPVVVILGKIDGSLDTVIGGDLDLECEDVVVLVEKISEQEVQEDALNCLKRKLIQKPLILHLFESNQRIFVPIELKVVLNLQNEVFGEWLLIIELCQERNPLREVLTLAIVSVLVPLIQNFQEV